MILWDPDGDIVRPDGTPGPRGLALAGAVRRARRPARPAPARRHAAHRPGGDPVFAGQFSHTWILDRQADAAAGKDWARRGSETELEDNAWRAAMRQAGDGLAHLGLQPRWLSPDLLAGGALRRDGVRALILPHALALSDAEVAAVRAFAAGGGMVLADIPPGGYDGHSRRRGRRRWTA